MAMNPDVKKILLDALKSGEYAKTQGRLARTYPDGTVGHCCLGVLTAEAAKAGVCQPLELSSYLTRDQNDQEWMVMEEEFDTFGLPYTARAFAFPPKSVYAWSGLTEGEAGILADINDHTETFDEVIENIETNL